MISYSNLQIFMAGKHTLTELRLKITQILTSYTLQFPRYSPDKNFKFTVNMAKVKGQIKVMRYSPDKIFKLNVTTRSNIQSRSNHDVAYLHPLTKLLTSYTLWFPKYSPDKILKVKVTTARSNQSHIMTLHTYTP